MFWVEDRKGVEVPVISARYSIWEHKNRNARSGTPAKVAREIRQTVENSPPGELPRYDWVIDHVWPYFRKAPGAGRDCRGHASGKRRRTGRSLRVRAGDVVRRAAAFDRQHRQSRGVDLARPHEA